MSASARWAIGSLLGIAAWVGAVLIVAITNTDPRNPLPIVLTFAGGAALFFGVVFGIALWQTRRRPSADLDELLGALTLDGRTPPTSATTLVGGRQTVRVYLVLGIVVTALGLAAIVLGVLGSTMTGVAVGVLVATLLVWAAAVPTVLRNRRADAAALLEPLGLAERAGVLSGIRHGRRVSVTFSGRGTRVRVTPSVGEPVVVERVGHTDGGWLLDLLEAEQRAEGASAV